MHGVLVVGLLYFIIFAVCIVDYIMKNIALTRIGKRRGIDNAWLVWFPYAGDYVIGKIAEEYDNHNGIKRHWGKILLALSISVTAIIVVMYASLMAIIVSSYSYAFYGEPFTYSDTLVLILMVYLFIAAIAIVATALSICKTICTYKIFESTVPEKSLKYMMVSLFVPLGEAICLNMAKEYGYTTPPYPTMFGGYGGGMYSGSAGGNTVPGNGGIKGNLGGNPISNSYNGNTYSGSYPHQ